MRLNMIVEAFCDPLAFSSFGSLPFCARFVTNVLLSICGGDYCRDVIRIELSRKMCSTYGHSDFLHDLELCMDHCMNRSRAYRKQLVLSSRQAVFA